MTDHSILCDRLDNDQSIESKDLSEKLSIMFNTSYSIDKNLEISDTPPVTLSEF